MWQSRKQGRVYGVVRDLVALAGTLRPRQLTTAHTSALLALWKRRGLAPATIKSYRDGAAMLLKHLARITGDTMPTIPRVRDPGPRTTIATPSEITSLLAHAPPPLRIAILIAIAGGWRAAECVRAAPSGWDRERQTMTITTKGGKPHTLPVTEELASALAATGATEDTAFCTAVHRSKFGKPYSQSTLWDQWATTKQNAGVNPDLIFHDLRRTVADAAYEVSRDLRVVSHILGHANIATTGRYLMHRDPEKLRPLLQQLWTPKGPVQ